MDEAGKRIAELERRLEAGERAARALADSERLYRALFEGTQSAVTIRSLEDQSFIECNAAALHLYRADTVEMLRGSKVTDLSANEQLDGTPSPQALRNVVARAIQNGTERCEWLARRLDGAPFIADVRIAILELEGGRRVMQTMIEDITDKKAGEDALRRRAERDELVGRISRRFLDGGAEAATRFAIESVGAFLGVAPDLVAPWVATQRSHAAASAPSDDVALVRLVGEMVAMARAREDAEEALRSSEERHRMLVERSRDAIVVIDLEGKVVFASPAATDMVGYSAEEWVGLGMSDLILAEDRGAIPGLLDALRKGQPGLPREWSLRRRDGTVVRVESIRTPVHDKLGRVAGAQLIARDVTERHRAEQMRDAAQVALAQATEDAIAASRAKSAFVANMSHELRTPLNGVIGMVDLLFGTALDARQKRYVEVARASASLLLSVINDVLDFSKIEAGKLEIEHIEFSFADVIEEVATTLELAAEEKGLDLTCQADPALAALVIGDPARVRQVLVNLITNAVKFTRQGEVAVRASIDGEADGGARVRVEVQDTGVGVSEDAQKKLFLPFSQVDASASRLHGGTGLGLAICRELVARMGGEIGVQSVMGAGSTFWFTVRVEKARRAGVDPHLVDDERLVGARVLAVDDNATNREILRAQLVAARVRCDVAPSGESALEKLLAAVEARAPYAVALLDQHMPGMDGCELARRIKADPRIDGTRLIMLGSIGRPLDGAQLQALGILAWATKPIWRPQLLRTLAAALDDEPAASSEASPMGARPTHASRRRVLLVEDTPINAEVAGEILRTAGYVVEVKVDGHQAVEAVKNDDYDVVLMDCQLPGIDGYEATRRIRELESSGGLSGERPGRLPIVALTASATVEDLQRARLAGMDGHIAKPVDARRLVASVAQHVDATRTPFLDPSKARSGDPGAAAARSGAVVDLHRALERLQGNHELLERMIVQFHEEAGAARGRLREGLARRDKGGLHYAAHRLRGQALSLDAEALVSALAVLEGAVAGGEWGAGAEALAKVEQEIDRLRDVLLHA